MEDAQVSHYHIEQGLNSQRGQFLKDMLSARAAKELGFSRILDARLKLVYVQRPNHEENLAMRT